VSGINLIRLMTSIMCRVCSFKLRLTVSINSHAEYDVKQRLVLTSALLLSVFSTMTWAEVITTQTNKRANGIV
jgi:hypothetical protein